MGMIGSIGLSRMMNSGEVDYMKSGVLIHGSTALAVMVASSSELTGLAGKVPVGSIAYTAGYGTMWQLDAAGEWMEIGAAPESEENPEQ